MSYNGYRFENIEAFESLQNLAVTQWIQTIGEFNKFIGNYFIKK